MSDPKHSMLEFMRQYYSDDVKEIINVDVKDTDDKYGAAFEHLIVKCRLKKLPRMSQIMSIPEDKQRIAEYEQTFLVDRYVFTMHQKEKKIIQPFDKPKCTKQ